MAKTAGEQFLQDAIAHPVETARAIQNGPQQTHEEWNAEWEARQALRERIDAGVAQVQDPRSRNTGDAS